MFQFRVVIDADSGKRRLCEERIITFEVSHARAALAEAKRRGKTAQYSYNNGNCHRGHFEFVGVLELLCLDPECAPDEVWYPVVERVTPMERRATLILSGEPAERHPLQPLFATPDNTVPRPASAFPPLSRISPEDAAQELQSDIE